jgi:hypothetical protein
MEQQEQVFVPWALFPWGAHIRDVRIRLPVMSKATWNCEYSGSPIEIIANQRKGGLLGASIPAR